ncbi:MAG TPA: prepilin peptidase [Tepidisphaeraceae bacterium]|nr:prepilin peptidase [Tepidisphaeraceae bacterium]
MPHLAYILFTFALGSCVGSFLNVVVWRLPRVERFENEGIFRDFYRSWRALSWPPSHCPKCNKLLKWYDNLPVIGWIKLGGRCRFCHEPISIRYPIIEAITGLLFVLYYVMFFMVGIGPCLHALMPDGVVRFLPAGLNIADHWPIYLLDMGLVSGLLAASLIDAELFIIPLEIPWFIVPFALLEHAVFDRPGWPGALNPSAPSAALAAGAGVGLLISFVLWWLKLIPSSFAEGGPMLEVEKEALARQKQQKQGEHSSVLEYEAQEPPDFTPAQIRAEMRKEMLFLLPPLALGLAWVVLTTKVRALAQFWGSVSDIGWVSGLLGSVQGLLVGGFVVWITRILGSFGFGREAMGMGDVHLMAAVGAVLGAGAATVAFFLAPFFGIALAIWLLFTGKRRELPYGPYLSLASAFVILFYCPIADWLSPGLTGLVEMISKAVGG